MIVIATPSGSKRCTVTAEHRVRFTKMMPQICRQAQVASRKLDAEARQEFVQGVVVAAYASLPLRNRAVTPGALFRDRLMTRSAAVINHVGLCIKSTTFRARLSCGLVGNLPHTTGSAGGC